MATRTSTLKVPKNGRSLIPDRQDFERNPDLSTIVLKDGQRIVRFVESSGNRGWIPAVAEIGHAFLRSARRSVAQKTIIRMHAPPPWQARASGVLLHGTGTETADELTRVNNHRPWIFLASPSRSTWLLAAHNGWPVSGSNDTSK